MGSKYEIILIGLGAMGSAAADAMARAGHSVLGFEQFSPAHDKGSSHGETRIIRKAYFEDPRYVPLILRAYELWEELEKEAREKLLVKPGCVIIGEADSPVIRGCTLSAKQFSLLHKMLDAKQLQTQYDFRVPHSAVAFFEPDGGYLCIEKCIEQFLRRAKRNGADLRFGTKSMAWREVGSGFEVTCDGETFQAEKLVICTGAWTGKYLPDEKFPLSPKRAVQFWFRSRHGEGLPVFFQDTSDGTWIYGFPKIGDTMKFAFHNVKEDCDPNLVNRIVSHAEVEHILQYAQALVPSVGEFVRAKTCMYTMTPDEHFLIGALKNPNLIVASGFSGHGFKFASVIGEVVEDLVVGRKRHAVELFQPYRF